MNNPKKPVKNLSITDLESDQSPEILPEKEPEIAEAEARIDRLQRILGAVAPGWTVTITRAKPGWASGFLETIDVSEGSDPVDLRYLADTWGGDVLRLHVKDEKGRFVGQSDVPMYSYPVKRWGTILINPTKEQPLQVAPAAMQNGLTLENVLGLIEKLAPKPAQNDLALGDILKILLNKTLTPAPAVQVAPAANGVQSLLETAQAIKSLQGLFGGDGGGADRGDAGGDIFGQINGLLESYAKIKGAERPAIGPVSNPGGARLPAGPSGGPFGGPAGAPGPLGGLDLAQIGKAIRALPPKEIAENMLSIVGQLPEAERTQVFQGIFDLLGIEAPQAVDDDDDDEDDDDGDEGDEGDDDRR